MLGAIMIAILSHMGRMSRQLMPSGIGLGEVVGRLIMVPQRK